ncbi:MAG: orotidine-5'-phosphate decarboxylase [Gemmatirosa sp.]|nr:orotidine-5'-phosphate decarboxylase [Gemmatirosa sp.]
MADLTDASPEPIVALDFADRRTALSFVDQVGDGCRFYKVGLELFTAEGPGVVAAVRERGPRVFLDLKLHDIPNTVAGAVRSAARLGASLLTVHATGGSTMLRAAADAAAGSGCDLLAVTVLTSLDADAAASVWGRPVPRLEDDVVRLAGLAADAGLHGVVCSGQEAALVRARWGPTLATLVPGIRRAGAGVDDQARIVTPAMAAAAGARYVVLGRAVTAAADPAAALASIVAELALPAVAG